MNEMDLVSIAKKYAQICHDNAGCTYGDNNGNYMIHLEQVANVVKKYIQIFNEPLDFLHTFAAAFTHDTIEDAQQTFNNVEQATNKEVAKIVLAVTDVHEENRLLRHLMTMGKTVKDYRAIVLKLCDIHANASYSKANGSSMYKKYVKEYEYRKPIFKTALKWYSEFLNEDMVDELWRELDEIHNYKKVV